ncbi:MAG TPA: histidine phosphatase family protein [Acidimicrobiia bacterium]|jgi:probable phosphoglycerate mutase|nr:histidine phosphatase family protein [Acidimicrobiia bacterium]
MDLLWIRHAEPERIAGGTGVPANPGLTERGQQQAQRLADWLAHEHVDVVLSSPQRRAQETAAPVAAAHGLDVVIHDGLVEYDVQNDSYIPMEELRANNDPQLLAMAEGRWEAFGGETPGEFRDRIAKTIDDIVGSYPGQRVVAVCHGGVVNVAMGIVLGLPAERPFFFDPHYTSLSRMVASRTGVRSIASVNERSHLEARRTP